MRALVVGGNGFLGSHLVDRLLDLKIDVTVFDAFDRRYDSMPPRVHFIRANLNQSYSVREAVAGMDIVFYLAWANIHEISNEDPASDVISNVIPALHFLQACLKAGIGRFIFISSGGTVYGPVTAFPTPESHSNHPLTSYGITKLTVEKYLSMFRALYNLDYVVLRPSVPYGPRQNPLLRQGAVSVFMHRVASGLPITIWGDGETLRDYFYVSDLVQALISAATSPLSDKRVFNIGGREEISLKSLVQRIETTLGKKALVDYCASRSFDAPRLALDTRLAADHLKWHPTVSLDQGLKSLWAWMRTVFSFK